MTFTWTTPDPLNNTAKTRSIYMTELQVASNARRLEIAQAQLTFIDQNIGKKFLLSAIEELKIVVNQLAIDFGYPTGVEDPYLLGRPYVSITKKYGKTVCHYPILNDLRLVLNALEFKFNIILPVMSGWAIVSEYKNSTMLIRNVVPFGIIHPSASVFWSSGNSLSDLYYDSGSILIAKTDITTGASMLGWDVGDLIRHRRGRDICAGMKLGALSYQYVLGQPLIGGSDRVITYANIMTSNLVAVDIFDLGVTYTSRSIINNENFVFVGGSLWTGAPGYYNAVITRFSKGIPLSLSNQLSFYLNLIPDPGGIIISKIANISALSIDSSYIYCFYQEAISYKILPGDPAPTVKKKSAILKIDASTLLPIVLIENDDTTLPGGTYTYGIPTGLVVQGNYLYTMGEVHVPTIGKLVIRTKNGTFVASFDSLNKQGGGSEIINVGSYNCIASKDEYLIGIPSS
jgi:hypothetical protein